MFPSGTIECKWVSGFVGVVGKRGRNGVKVNNRSSTEQATRPVCTAILPKSSVCDHFYVSNTVLTKKGSSDFRI